MFAFELPGFRVRYVSFVDIDSRLFQTSLYVQLQFEVNTRQHYSAINRSLLKNADIIHRRTRTLPKAKTIEKNQNADETPSLDLSSGFIKLHVLHHASEQPVYGLWLIDELAEHGYRVSPGTLYPLLHSLEQSKMLTSYNEVSSGKVRRYYTITAPGRRQLKKAKLQLMELLGEILTKDEVEQLTNHVDH